MNTNSLKIFSIFMMLAGPFLMIFVVQGLPGWVIGMLLVAGSALGLTVIVKEKGIKKAILPLLLWGGVLASIAMLLIDFSLNLSVGLDSFKWLTPMVLFGIAAIFSTIVLMLKKQKL